MYVVLTDHGGVRHRVAVPRDVERKGAGEIDAWVAARAAELGAPPLFPASLPPAADAPAESADAPTDSED